MCGGLGYTTALIFFFITLRDRIFFSLPLDTIGASGQSSLSVGVLKVLPGVTKG